MNDSPHHRRLQDVHPSVHKGMGSRLKLLLFGTPKDPTDPHIFHKLSLVALLAWVGLGADGLSSSSYGPDEAFRALAGHEYLAFYLALLTTFTVIIISYSYSLVVEHFPTGGGGYVVASKLLGPIPGVVSGSALVVDYILTITVSVCSGVDAIMSFLPIAWQVWKVPADLCILGVLLLFNLRGVKESVKILAPIFGIFVVTHVALIGYGVMAHFGVLPTVLHDVHANLASDVSRLGWWVVLLIFLRAYSLGGGTYTGIEAVSNGLQILREPRPQTAKRTMALMAVSLAFTAGGIFLCYLLWSAAPEVGKTMNAVLLGRVFGDWVVGGLPVGYWLVIITLLSEGALLFVAAQAGFVDGPRVLANMAVDSWVPHRFANLSERLVTGNGVVLMAVASAGLIVYTGGKVSFLVVLYSINVFLTFSLTQLGMSRMWWQKRREGGGWGWKLGVHGLTLLLCVSILVVTTFEKFMEGGWLTFAITSTLIGGCMLAQRHYRGVRTEIRELDGVLTALPLAEQPVGAAHLQHDQPVAALLVSGYGGLGIHSLLNIHRTFPGFYHNILFLSSGVVDSGHFKGKEEVEALVTQTRANLERYVELARRLGFNAEQRFLIGTDVVEATDELCQEVAREFPRAVFFLGKLVFARERFYYRFLHNDTAFAVQRRLQFSGLQTVVLPIRMRLGETSLPPLPGRIPAQPSAPAAKPGQGKHKKSKHRR